MKEKSLPVVALFFVLVFGSATVAQTKVTDEVLKIEQARVEALTGGNFAALEKLLAEDLVYTHSSGVVEDKKQFLEALKSGAVKYEGMTESEVKARAYGTTVILTGKSQMKLQSRGQGLSFAIRFTAVYIKQGSGWQLASWQSTRLPS